MSNGNTAFQVPKDRQSVVVRLTQGAVLEGEIFLESMAEGLSTHQKVTAFLENSLAFFPIKVSPDGKTEFINKQKVRTVEVAVTAAPETDYFEHLLMHTIPVTTFFGAAESISGELMAEAPQEKARLSDCLNMPNTFLCVRTASMICYINKESLQKVVYKA